jgi:hypothetical protein
VLFVQRDAFNSDVVDVVRRKLLSYTGESWDRYNNPFEQKSVLRKPYSDGGIANLMNLLQSQRYLCERLMSQSLWLDHDGHFSAVFKYEEWDKLALHLDAEVDPATKRAKVVTALLYLSTDNEIGSNLEFFDGTVDNPIRQTVEITPTFNTLVMFNGGWHGNPDPVMKGTRLVMTCSFLGEVMESGRERAFFAPYPGETWDQSIMELRDIRANPYRYAEAYR